MISTSPETNNICAALALAQAKFKSIPKDKVVTKRGVSKTGKPFEYSYNYSAFETIVEHTKEPLAAAGISFVQSIIKEGHTGTCVTRLMHSSGQYIETTFPLVFKEEDMQQYGGVSTYGKRYALTNILGIATDDDLDANETTDETFKVDARPQYIRAPSYSGTPAQTKATAPNMSESAPSATAAEIYRPPAGNYKSNPLSDKQLARMYAIGKKQKWSVQLIQNHIKEKFNKAPSDMSRKEYEDICDYFGTVECGSGYQPGKSVVEQMEKVKKTGYVDHTTNFVPGPDTDEIPF